MSLCNETELHERVGAASQVLHLTETSFQVGGTHARRSLARAKEMRREPRRRAVRGVVTARRRSHRAGLTPGV
eukprot:1372626-Pyramimonas_sp.AAC.1